MGKDSLINCFRIQWCATLYTAYCIHVAAHSRIYSNILVLVAYTL